MIVAWHRAMSDVSVLGRRFQDHAMIELIDHTALDFLPGRLARRHIVGSAVEATATYGQFLIRDQDIGGPAFEIDPQQISGFDQRQSAANRRLGRGIQDRRRSAGAGLTAIADACSSRIPCLMSASGGCILTTSAPPG